ncbi:protein ALP1-like [Prosopis cineraria]|uniref:protein ALP1-like n=1 Tax=Prosopis cineraria TaxID=364024 RepID=UPI00240F7301|nr:protein ALP1-like [Prosopis cineraria]
MKISSPPWDDYSHFHNLNPEMDSWFGLNNDDVVGNVNGYDDLKNSNTLRDVFTSLILLDDEDENEERSARAMESERDKALFQYNNKQQAQALINYYMQLQDHYYSDEMNELEFDHFRTKRARRSTSTESVSASAFVFENVGSEIPAPMLASSGSSSSSSGEHHNHHHRRLWVKQRSRGWWERCNHPDFPEEEFRRCFRMSKATFNMICYELESVVTKKNTTLRNAIPVKQRVAVCIWSLATGDSLRLVSEQFGLGVSTCHKLVLEVCSAIKTVLMPKFLHWPDEAKMNEIKNEYELISGGIPNIGGSIYTTHVPINAPKNISTASSYFNKHHTERNQKTSYSIAVQGVVDPQGIFTDVFIGGPGSLPDDKVLEISGLYQLRASLGLLNDAWMVGNSGFPLMDWVLVPYTEKNLTWCQQVFNEKIGKIQKVAKEAFGRLKGRWGCLQKRREMKLDDLPVIVGACCVLHNICEMRNEEMDPQWKLDVFDDDEEVNIGSDQNNIASAYSVLARDYIAYNLLWMALQGTSQQVTS